jgi:hypothetical protein
MGKRSDFERISRDFYRTPTEAVLPLRPFFGGGETFCEPCAGDGALVRALISIGLECVSAYDIQPQEDWIWFQDALQLEEQYVAGCDFIITNPPWDRTLLHPLIEKLSDLRPTWLLFDADWVHTKQSINYLPRLRKIVSIGRVKWFDKTAGKDNSCWYLFDKPSDIAVEFYGRKNPQALA